MSKTRLALAGTVIAGIALFVWAARGRAGEELSFRFVSVERGNLEQVVAATGSLDAVTTVPVGTQVSGIISEIYVDFNDDVNAGQVVARLDRSLLQIAVQDAQANLARSEAQYDFVKRNHERTAALYEQQLVSEQEFNQSQYDLRTAEATYASSRSSLDRAEQNLGYATIYAPISGRVIERNVDVGQTVAASMSAPQLFLIANDLSEMQILASVDESDIGKIHEGQTARFTVQAYPDDKFEGEVRQVRLQSKVQENVVNYTVVVGVKNASGKLLPGMTATVDFLVGTATDVLKIPNAALRFRPPESLLSELQERRRAEFEARRTERAAGGETVDPGAAPDSSAAPRTGRRGGVGGTGRPGGGAGGQGGLAGGRGNFNPDDFAVLYTLDDQGRLSAVRARKGLTDGQYTEIQGPNVEEGMQVIAAVTTGTSAASGTAANPLQPGGAGGRDGPGGPPRGPRF